MQFILKIFLNFRHYINLNGTIELDIRQLRPPAVALGR